MQVVASAFELETAALHEIGHSSVEGAIMFSFTTVEPEKQKCGVFGRCYKENLLHSIKDLSAVGENHLQRSRNVHHIDHVMPSLHSLLCSRKIEVASVSQLL